MQRLCSQLCYVTAANQRTAVEIELLATLGWKWRCQPFSCRCSQNGRTAEQRFVQHLCLRNPFLPFLFGNFKLPLHTRSKFLRAAERSSMSALGLSCPSLRCIFRKKTCPMQRNKGFGHGVVVSKICYNAVIVLSVVLCDCCKPMNNCRDWAFSNNRLEVWLPAFQLSMFAKCDSLPNRDLFNTFV